MPRPTGNRRPDQPEPGTFKVRLVKAGPWVAARITLSADGRWGLVINGLLRGEATDPWQMADMERVWFWGHRIDEAEYAYLAATHDWAREHAPDHPAASPGKPIDLKQQRSLF